VVFGSLVLGTLGVVAGALARWLLARLPRGADVRPPWCELSVGLAWAACGGLWAEGMLPARWLPLLLGLAWLAVAAGTTDLLHRRLPDMVTLPALPIALLATLPLGTPSMWRAALGAAALFGVYLTVRVSAPAALGAGDVKLAAPRGAALAAVSWSALLAGTVLASVLTAAVALGGWVARVAGGRHRGEVGATIGVPHGPSMLVSGWFVTFVAVLAGAP
jgi:leader peptidase (prepilin peptidase)/N-methyltransferase